MSAPQQPDNEPQIPILPILGIAALAAMPFAALFGAITFFQYRYRRVAPTTLWLVAAATVVVVFASMLITGPRIVGSYIDAYKALIGAMTGDTPDPGAAFKSAFQMLPLSLLIGTVGGAAWSSWKWKARPPWERNDLRAGPKEKRRRKRTITEINADRNGPDDGITLGVGPDGARVVQTDREAAAHTLLTGASGSGKALAVDTPIATPNGWVTMGDLVAGDYVYGPDGCPTEVVGAYDIMTGHDCFNVTLNDETVITADADHLWTVTLDDKIIVTVATRDLYDLMTKRPGSVTIDLPHQNHIQYPNTAHPDDDPYLAGMTAAKQATLPDKYLTYTVEDRARFWRGIFEAVHVRLPIGLHAAGMKTLTAAEQFRELSASLGIRTIIRTHQGGGPSGTTTHFVIALHNADLADASGNPTVRLPHRIDSITPTESVPVRCIKVARSDGLFCAGRTYAVTHNTTAGLVGMRDLIRRGVGLVVVDLKGGTDVPEALAAWSAQHGRRFQQFTFHNMRSGYSYEGPAADGPAFYDPAGRGDPTRRKDLLIGSQRWDVEYYQNIVENYLQYAFIADQIVPGPPEQSTFDRLAFLLVPDNLRALAERHENDFAQHYRGLEFRDSILRITARPNEGERSAIGSMYTRMEVLRASVAGDYLRTDPFGDNNIDLYRSALEGGVVVFSLDTSNYEVLSRQIANLIVQDLKTVSSELRANPAFKPMHLFIDEFTGLNGESVITLLNKCRDAGIPATIATQSLPDLARVNDAFLGQILGLVTCFKILRANTDEEAQVFAGLTGRDITYRRRFNVAVGGGDSGIDFGNATGRGAVEEVEDFRVPSRTFQDLPQGHMVYVAKAPSLRIVNPVEVIPASWEPVTQRYANRPPRPHPGYAPPASLAGPPAGAAGATQPISEPTSTQQPAPQHSTPTAPEVPVVPEIGSQFGGNPTPTDPTGITLGWNPDSHTTTEPFDLTPVAEPEPEPAPQPYEPPSQPVTQSAAPPAPGVPPTPQAGPPRSPFTAAPPPRAPMAPGRAPLPSRAPASTPPSTSPQPAAVPPASPSPQPPASRPAASPPAPPRTADQDLPDVGGTW